MKLALLWGNGAQSRVRPLFFIFSLLFCLSLAAQSTVSGTVTDQDGDPLIGASVLVEGTSSGTVTDFDGKYSLNVPDGATTLSVSYVGFETTEIEIAGQSTIDIALAEGSVGLDAVTVTALGIEKETKALGYAVQELGGNEISQVKDPNLVNNLTGKVAGVTVTAGGSG
ncbi:MAG: carboxypeptidase-like regulatory domain-containing protein, partial [Bacteroidota bacterium]